MCNVASNSEFFCSIISFLCECEVYISEERRFPLSIFQGNSKMEETAPGGATVTILTHRDSLQSCKDELMTCQTKLEAAKSEIQICHSSFHYLPFIPPGRTPEPKLVIDCLQTLKSSEEA
ncbi:hypothetical protein SLA2020_509560 [Shorea laevis]